MANAGKEFFKNRYMQLGGRLEEIKIIPSLRINTLKTTAKELIPRLEKNNIKLTKIPFTKNGYYAESKFSIGAITEYLLGYYYIQEAAPQLPVEILDPKPNEIILDCCASPGGKTTQMAAKMKNTGTIIAYELKKHRIPSLINNLERCGIKNTTVFSGNFAQAKKLGIHFDKILLDAPCAGNYLSEPGWLEKRDYDGILTSCLIQKRLIADAVELLKPNGILIYSNCSLELEENELNIEWALKELPISLQKINLPIGDEGLTEIFGKKLNPEIQKCKRFWPHKTGTEGFFICKMVKNA